MILKVHFIPIAFALFSINAHAQTLKFQWAESTGGVLQDIGTSTTTDTSGNVYITGNFRDIVDFDPGPGTTSLTSKGKGDIFVQKLDSAGTLLWAKSLGGHQNDESYFITIDTSGNIYVVGSFQDTVDFDPGPGTTNLISKGRNDIFIQKLDASGLLIWVNSYGGTLMDIAYSVCIDNRDNIYPIEPYPVEYASKLVQHIENRFSSSS